jgi:hypothetical protein
MTTFGDMLKQFGGVPVSAFIPEMLAGGNWFFCDPTNGLNEHDGLTPQTAKKTLLAAYNLTRDGYNDGVIFMGGATAWNPTAMLTWSNSYTHLVGTNNLPGLGNRCRIVSQASAALTVPVTFSGNGCHIKNLQIYNEKAAGAAAGCAIVTGDRCLFENVFTLTPVATDAASYSLKLSGTECAFVRCTIGQSTNVRTGASRNLWIHSDDASGNKFIGCEFLSWSGATTHVLVYLDVDITNEAFNVSFEDCMFANIVSGSGTLAVGIDDNCATGDHQIRLRGHNCFAGCTAVADPLTYVLHAEMTGTKSGLLMAAVNES